MLHGSHASSGGRIPEEDVSSAGTCGRSILVQTQQGPAQASKIPPQQSQGLLAGAPGEHHAHGSSGGKSRRNNYMTLLHFHRPRAHANICLLVPPRMCRSHDSISFLVEHDFPRRSVRAITCINKPRHLQIAFALPLAFIYASHVSPRQKSPLLEPVDKTQSEPLQVSEGQGEGERARATPAQQICGCKARQLLKLPF